MKGQIIKLWYKIQIKSFRLGCGAKAFGAQGQNINLHSFYNYIVKYVVRVTITIASALPHG